MTGSCEQSIFLLLLWQYKVTFLIMTILINVLLCGMHPTNPAFPSHFFLPSVSAHFQFLKKAINTVVCNNMRSFSWGVAVTSSSSCCFYACMFLSRHNMQDWQVLIILWCQFASLVHFTNQMETAMLLLNSYRAQSLFRKAGWIHCPHNYYYSALLVGKSYPLLGFLSILSLVSPSFHLFGQITLFFSHPRCPPCALAKCCYGN